MLKTSPGKTATALGAILVMAAMTIPATASAAPARPAVRATTARPVMHATRTAVARSTTARATTARSTTARAARPQAAKLAVLRAFCHSRKAIPVTAVPATIDLATCPLNGRLFVLPIPHERTGPGVYTPKPGYTTTGNALTTNGSYTLSVTNANGRLIIKTRTPRTGITQVPRHVARLDAACSENGMTTEGAVWRSTLNWYYNESTVSRAGLSGSATLSDIRAGNTNMTMGINNCGWSEQGFNAFGAYQGTTSRYANIDSSGHCTGNFPDGQNTVSWGPFYGNSYLAYTCWSASGGAMHEADIYLGSNVSMVDNVGSPCNGGIDLQSDVTHEWGHAYGLNDLTNSAYSAEVMYQTKFPCELRRHLGEGDYNGMGIMYFPR